MTVSSDGVKAPVDVVLAWLLTPPDVKPVPEDWVPGRRSRSAFAWLRWAVS